MRTAVEHIFWMGIRKDSEEDGIVFQGGAVLKPPCHLDDLVMGLGSDPLYKISHTWQKALKALDLPAYVLANPKMAALLPRGDNLLAVLWGGIPLTELPEPEKALTDLRKHFQDQGWTLQSQPLADLA